MKKQTEYTHGKCKINSIMIVQPSQAHPKWCLQSVIHVISYYLLIVKLFLGPADFHSNCPGFLWKGSRGPTANWQSHAVGVFLPTAHSSLIHSTYEHKGLTQTEVKLKNTRNQPGLKLQQSALNHPR